MTINMWNNEYNDEYTYYYNINSFLKAIEKGQFKYDFSFKSKYKYGEKITNPYELNALLKKYNIKYTDKDHPICLGPFESYIDKDFFEKNKKEIINKIQKKILNDTTSSFITINKYVLSENFLKKILEKYNNQRLIFKNVLLNETQKKILKENHIYADEIINGQKKSISTNIAYGSYTFQDLNKQRNINIASDIKDEEIQNFKNINNLIITIDNIENSEEEYYKKLKNILPKFDKINTTLIIRIECEKRSIFDKYLLNTNYKNINLLVNNDFYDYPIEDFIKEEKILYCMVSRIKKSNCSPFEKFISIYNIVKNYKPYSEVKEGENLDLSRNLRYILNNEYIVCIGYTKLLRELLDKVGIESTIYNTSVDISYEDGFTLEEIPITYCRHSRLLVNIVDQKYNINGFYLSDPTWDNDDKIDKYSNMIMPFDYMQKSRYLFKLEDIDYLFDVHNIEEFNYRFQILFNKKYKQKIKNNTTKKTDYINNIIDTYCEIIHLMTKTIKSIDYNKYNEINKIWKILIYNENDDYKLLQNYQNFINYISSYIISKSNNYIKKETIINAIINSKKEMGQIFTDDITSELLNEFDKYDYFDRPYEFPENYLSNNDDGITIKKRIL